MYKLTENSDLILRLTDNATIPNDPSNADWQKYLVWIASGNAPLPYRNGNPLQLAKADKLKFLADFRYRNEVKGIIHKNTKISTDRESQGKIAGLVLMAQLAIQSSQNLSITWKGEGNWLDLDAESSVELGRAVSLHIQACFALEREHGEAIASCETIEALNDYNYERGWP